jgi:diguanylate cyclase (GGDEF)-like protein
MRNLFALKLKNRTVPLLILGAAGAVLFICVAAIFVYKTSRHLLLAHDWEEHSQEVLNALQIASQRLDRIDLTSRLYFAAKNEEDLRSAQSTVVALDTGVIRLEDLSRDNISQTRHARSLYNCAQDLKQLASDDLPHGTPAAETAVLGKVLQCRGDVSQMQAEENALLKARTSESQQSEYKSLLSGALYLIVSVAVVLTLFGVLLRDAKKRFQTEENISKTNARLAESVKTLEYRAAETALQTAAREELQLCLNPAQAHQATVRNCFRLLPLTNVALLIINNSRRTVEVAATAGTGAVQVRDGFALESCCGLRGGQTRWRKPGGSEIDCMHFQGTAPPNYLCMPLTAHGETMGFLYAECPSDQAALQLENRLDALKSMVKMAAIFIGGLDLRTRLEHQSIRDSMTNLFNRHFMEIYLEREIGRAARSDTELAVFMLDLDHFKHFNDTYGHEAGDHVLRATADVFRSVVRTEDVVCRYGGEEFVMILPDTGMEIALERAEEVRRSIHSLHLQFRGKTLQEVTISIGIAIYPVSGITPEELLRHADRALYAAKKKGRNRVEASDTMVPA